MYLVDRLYTVIHKTQKNHEENLAICKGWWIVLYNFANDLTGLPYVHDFHLQLLHVRFQRKQFPLVIFHLTGFPLAMFPLAGVASTYAFPTDQVPTCSQLYYFQLSFSFIRNQKLADSPNKMR